MAVPTGGEAHVPCVRLLADGEEANPCEAAGGTFEEREATLVDHGAADTNVAVCEATLTAGAMDFGIEGVPVPTVC